MYQVGDKVKLKEGYHNGQSSAPTGTITRQGDLGYPNGERGFDHTYDIQWDGSSVIDTAGWFEWSLMPIENEHSLDVEILTAIRKWIEFFNASS